jgi:hypothetical protein
MMLSLSSRRWRAEFVEKLPGGNWCRRSRKRSDCPDRRARTPAAIEPTGKSEPDTPAKAKATPIRGPPVPPAWYTLREFATAHRLSMAMLYKLKKQKRGPAEIAVGSRRYITFEDAAAWRAAQKEAVAT